jgi:hypothetical protein
MAAPVADITWGAVGGSGIIASNGTKVPVHLLDGSRVVVKLKAGMTASAVVAACARAVSGVAPVFLTVPQCLQCFLCPVEVG